MKRNSLILSILTIVLCATLIAGSSFALFTSESKVNVAVTAGTVKVTATASEPELSSTLGNNVAETSASLENNTITLDKIVPGDVVEFDIVIHNESDVTVKYRTALELISGAKLWGGLEVTIEQVQTETEPSPLSLDGEEEDDTVATPYDTMIPGCDDITLHVTVTLPVEAGNEYQGESCTFAFVVEAVQGNGEFDTVYVYTIEELRAAVAADNGKKIVLMADIEISDEERDTTDTTQNFNCILKVNKDAVIDLNGHALKYIGGKQCAIALYVCGDAVLSLYDTSADKTGLVTGNDPSGGWMVFVNNSATANVYGGTFWSDGGAVIYKQTTEATLNFYGGKVMTNTDPGGMLNVKDGRGVINVYGGSFRNFNPETQNVSEINIPTGYKVVSETLADGTWYSVVPAEAE